MIERGRWPRRKHRGHYTFKVETPVSYRMPWGERNTRLAEMQRWCREHVGEQDKDWNHRYAHVPLDEMARTDRPLMFLFNDERAAIAFMLRYKE